MTAQIDPALKANLSMQDGGLWSPAELEVTVSGGIVNLAITKDHAVDSYNVEFTSDIVLSPEKAAELRDFLNMVLA